MSKRRDLFTTVHSEGGLLPSDILQRIVEGDRTLGGLEPENFHLAPGERLNEAVNRSWNRLIATWPAFKNSVERLAVTDAATGMTRERWLFILFQELGFGRLPVAKNVQLDGKHYPLSHLWQNVPIHLVGWNVDINKKTAGVAGASKMTPHGMVQVILNRSAVWQWGIVSNGRILRLLRDNRSLTRQSYVEFDLEGMFDGEVYSDFVLLWLLCHQSRFESGDGQDCWLEQWAKAVQDEGIRVLDHLRNGVEQAIVALGRGFLSHPYNHELKEKLRSGELDKQNYFRQLLRMVYRWIFLFTAEERDLLHPPDATPEQREIYARYYSLSRLRQMAERPRGTAHHDLYEAIKLVMHRLGTDEGCPELGLPALGSFLWSDDATPDLAEAKLANRHLLDAIRALTFTQDGNIRRFVSYKNLGAEELGSVYESLLELYPKIDITATDEEKRFELSTAAGSERKTTGSYYTPTSLINCLLDSALEPVLSEAASKPNAEEAILNLKICDPACGSGHFLIAAAHRVAKRLASVRTGDEEPSPETVRHALRDVISHCIYGVDINEMAVELCKVNLWMEALEPGKPLSFLDHRILCGNSLLGTTPDLIAKGIPDEAFKPIEGDDREVCSKYKKRNREERASYSPLFDYTGSAVNASQWMTREALSLVQYGEDTIADIHSKEKDYRKFITSKEYRHAKLLADAWCAAFVIKKDKDHPAVTQAVLEMLGNKPDAVPESLKAEINRLAERYQFFHWHLAFPEVCIAPKDGFDVVIGNPPWEKKQSEELQFFAIHQSPIVKLAGSSRKKAIEKLKTEDTNLHELWMQQKRLNAGFLHFVRNSGSYPLTAVGKFNTFALFCELGKIILGRKGLMGKIVPSGIATDDTTKVFFNFLISEKRLCSLYDFENRNGIFPGVHRSYRFCLLTVIGSDRSPVQEASFMFFTTSILDLASDFRHFKLSYTDFLLLNPNTLNCPMFRTRKDAEIAKNVYKTVPVFYNEKNDLNYYKSRVWRLLNTTDDSEHFLSAGDITSCGSGMVPVVEAKTIHQFDHRYATYDGLDLRGVELEEKENPHFQSKARFYIDNEYFQTRLPVELTNKQWFLTFRNITHALNERTVIASLIPRGAGCEVTPYIELFPKNPAKALFILGVMNSFIVDYLARQKVGGTHLSYFILYQIPILPDNQVGEFGQVFFKNRLLELTYTSWSLSDFAKEIGCITPPFRWDESRRKVIRCELDAAFFHLYGIKREDVDYIMETFPIVKRKDEAEFGCYRTKEKILEIYDRMQKAMDTGKPFVSELNPPPGPPAKWPLPPGAPWPEHIHRPS